MKRIKNIWGKTCTLENVKREWEKYNKTLKKNKRRPYNEDTAKFILERLKDHDVAIYPFKTRIIGGVEHGTKRRELTMPSFESIIAQNILLTYLGPLLNQKIHHRSFSSRKNMGMHKSARIQNSLVQNDSRIKYALVFDIKKFYDTINIDLLIDYLKKTAIKDKDILETLTNLLKKHPNGLAVGFCVSHFCANYYLCPLRKAIIESNRNVIDCFVYMDNFVVYTRTKAACKAAKAAAAKWLAERNLKIKEDWQYFPVDKKPIKTCGVLIQRGKRLKLYDRAFIKVMSNIKKITTRFCESLFKSLGSRLGGLKLIGRLDLLYRNISWENVKKT